MLTDSDYDFIRTTSTLTLQAELDCYRTSPVHADGEYARELAHEILRRTKVKEALCESPSTPELPSA